ncbi:MAG TPA: hypothetical protein HA257_08395 [Candidatus Methanoperedenaceae archaeon]|nr:hypothetical protein [Candidatus Methanoperedenaceae archaeon]
MVDIFLQVLILMTMVFGLCTVVLGYRAIQKLTEGRLKSYAMMVWYALLFFSVGGFLQSMDEFFGNNESTYAFFEYIFYVAYYMLLLYAIYMLYEMSRQFRLAEKIKLMREAKGEGAK